MTNIVITVTGASASGIAYGVLTSGMIGVPVSFSFDESWSGLQKTAVFSVGWCTKDVLLEEDNAIVPWEVLSKKGYTLRVGVYGIADDASIAIPTVWAEIGTIMAGTDPSGDESADPTKPVYQEMLDKVNEVTDEIIRRADSGEFNGKDGYTPIKGLDYFDGEKGEPGRDGAPGVGIPGKDGEPGKDGAPGRDGYTPIKGIDYFDGEKGEPGRDGHTPVKGVDYFDGINGTPGRDGIDGKNGVDGHTPVRGVDYYTEADKAEIIGSVINALPKYNGEVIA